MNKINKYKQDIFDFYSNNIEILKVSIIYDCIYLFETLENVTDENEKKILAKSFSGFLWAKYIMGGENRDPENGLVNLVRDDCTDELLMNTTNYFDFVADGNKEQIKYYREKIISYKK